MRTLLLLALALLSLGASAQSGSVHDDATDDQAGMVEYSDDVSGFTPDPSIPDDMSLWTAGTISPRPSPEQAGSADPGMATVAEADEVSRDGLRGEVVGIKPQLGVISLRDSGGEDETRAAAGFSLDVNATSPSRFYVGPSTGAFFSHIDDGANLLLLPANLKVGYHFGDFRVAARGGGNVTYRSSLDADNEASWTFLPNVGADFEYRVSDRVSVIARPDWTINGSNRIFTGTLGAAIPLG